MQLAVAIVSALVSLAGMGLKLWFQHKAVKDAEAETTKWKALAAAATKENIKLRQLVANKEVALAKAQAALASKLSASELVDVLNELFGGAKPSPGPAAAPGGPVPPAR